MSAGEIATWVFVVMGVVLLGVFLARVMRSFRRWPTTDDERRSFI